MKVYILLESWDFFDSYEVVDVFHSEDKAQDRWAELVRAQKPIGSGPDYKIMEKEIK